MVIIKDANGNILFQMEGDLYVDHIKTLSCNDVLTEDEFLVSQGEIQIHQDDKSMSIQPDGNMTESRIVTL